MCMCLKSVEKAFTPSKLLLFVTDNDLFLIFIYFRWENRRIGCTFLYRSV